MRVRDLMTTDVVTITPTAPLKAVAGVLAQRRISGAPVVLDGELLGVISESDIVAKESAAEEEAPGLLARVFGRRRRSLLEAVRASQAMSSPAMTVEPWVSAEGAAWQMVEHGVNRLPVVERGKLVGIVTRGDLVRAFARSDDEIAREIRDEVLPSLGLSPNDVRVTVELGKVRLEGEAPASEAEILPRSIHRVVGVVSVETSLDVRMPA